MYLMLIHFVIEEKRSWFLAQKKNKLTQNTIIPYRKAGLEFQSIKRVARLCLKYTNTILFIRMIHINFTNITIWHLKLIAIIIWPNKKLFFDSLHFLGFNVIFYASLLHTNFTKFIHSIKHLLVRFIEQEECKKISLEKEYSSQFSI